MGNPKCCSCHWNRNRGKKLLMCSFSHENCLKGASPPTHFLVIIPHFRLSEWKWKEIYIKVVNPLIKCSPPLCTIIVPVFCKKKTKKNKKTARLYRYKLRSRHSADSSLGTQLQWVGAEPSHWCQQTDSAERRAHIGTIGQFFLFF